MRRVFSHWGYCLFAAALAGIAYLLVVWFQNTSLIFAMLTNPALPVRDAVRISVQLLAAALSDLSPLSMLYVLIFAGLLGINGSLLLFYFRMYRAAPGAIAVSGILGSLAALLGFGCAACGSIFLSALLGTGAGFLSFLPFAGEEIGWGGLLLLLISTIVLVRAINKPRICPI